MMNRDEAYTIVTEYVKNPNLIKHMLAVEAAMRFYARKYGEDEEKWAVAGLLHDFDWEIHPTMEEHPQAGEPILREKGVSDEIIHAVLSHANHTGVSRETLMEKALFACDEVTGLITAVALVRPSKALYDLKVKSVKKKWKDKSFAAGANREEMEQGAEELGIDLWEHVGNVIQAMDAIAEDLGLAGSPEKDQ
jgi:putative nucleotidyltransferase with HDIG domain